MHTGFLNLLKPPGMTSHDVVDFVRRRLGKSHKVGHLGTLDPGASGVLPLALGGATRFISHLPKAEKSYLAEVWFGRTSDTWDAHGEIQEHEDAEDLAGRLPALLTQYQGTIMQVPPQVSALKRDGKRGYERARAGEDFQFEPREAHYTSVHMRSCQGQRAWLEVECGPGTYVRSLAHELGQRLGSGALLSALIRTGSGRFQIDAACTLEELLGPDCPNHWPVLPVRWPFGESYSRDSLPSELRGAFQE